MPLGRKQCSYSAPCATDRCVMATYDVKVRWWVSTLDPRSLRMHAAVAPDAADNSNYFRVVDTTHRWNGSATLVYIWVGWVIAWVTLGVWTSLPITHSVERRQYCKFSILWSIKNVSYTLTISPNVIGFYYSDDKIIRIMFIVLYCFCNTLLIMFLNQSQFSALSSTHCSSRSVYSVTQWLKLSLVRPGKRFGGDAFMPWRSIRFRLFDFDA